MTHWTFSQPHGGTAADSASILSSEPPFIQIDAPAEDKGLPLGQERSSDHFAMQITSTSQSSPNQLQIPILDGKTKERLELGPLPHQSHTTSASQNHQTQSKVTPTPYRAYTTSTSQDFQDHSQFPIQRPLRSHPVTPAALQDVMPRARDTEGKESDNTRKQAHVAKVPTRTTSSTTTDTSTSIDYDGCAPVWPLYRVADLGRRISSKMRRCVSMSSLSSRGVNMGKERSEKAPRRRLTKRPKTSCSDPCLISRRFCHPTNDEVTSMLRDHTHREDDTSQRQTEHPRQADHQRQLEYQRHLKYQNPVGSQKEVGYQREIEHQPEVEVQDQLFDFLLRDVRGENPTFDLEDVFSETREIAQTLPPNSNAPDVHDTISIPTIESQRHDSSRQSKVPRKPVGHTIDVHKPLPATPSMDLGEPLPAKSSPDLDNPTLANVNELQAIGYGPLSPKTIQRLHRAGSEAQKSRRKLQATGIRRTDTDLLLTPEVTETSSEWTEGTRTSKQSLTSEQENDVLLKSLTEEFATQIGRSVSPEWLDTWIKDSSIRSRCEPGPSKKGE